MSSVIKTLERSLEMINYKIISVEKNIVQLEQDVVTNKNDLAKLLVEKEETEAAILNLRG